MVASAATETGARQPAMSTRGGNPRFGLTLILFVVNATCTLWLASGFSTTQRQVEDAWRQYSSAHVALRTALSQLADRTPPTSAAGISAPKSASKAVSTGPASFNAWASQWNAAVDAHIAHNLSIAGCMPSDAADGVSKGQTCGQALRGVAELGTLAKRARHVVEQLNSAAATQPAGADHLPPNAPAGATSKRQKTLGAPTMQQSCFEPASGRGEGHAAVLNPAMQRALSELLALLATPAVADRGTSARDAVDLFLSRLQAVTRDAGDGGGGANWGGGGGGDGAPATLSAVDAAAAAAVHHAETHLVPNLERLWLRNFHPDGTPRMRPLFATAPEG